MSEERPTPEGWEWQCAGCHRPVAPMGMCETCGVFGIMHVAEVERARPLGLRWCGEREAHRAHDECDGWKADVSLFLALREHHRGLVKRGLGFCPRCGLRIGDPA